MDPVRPSSDTDAQEIAALRTRLETLEWENTRLLEDERARLQETKAFAAIGRLLSERLDPDVVGLRIAETLSALPGGRSSVVYRLDRQETILLVEDEEDVRALAREVLQRQGHSVLEAGDGVQALQRYEAEGERIDLILTDVVMPRMSGRELVDRVRAIRPTMPVLYMSGYTEDAIVRHGVRDSSVLLLGKPFTPADLISKVREVLDKSR